MWTGTDYQTLSIATNPSSLKYAHWTGATWAVTTVDSNYAGSGCSLALDSNDNPHISYYSVTHRDPHAGDIGPLNYAFWDGSSWVTQKVTSGSPPGESSLALDYSNRPHIAMSDSASRGRTYISWNGSSWATNIIGLYPDANAYGSGSGVSLALDSSNRPYVSYCFAKFNTVAVAFGWWNGSGWVTEVVDQNTGSYTMSAASYATSIALDLAGKPVISYIDGGKLVITGFTSPSPSITSAPSISESPQSSLPSGSIHVTSPLNSASPEVPEFPEGGYLIIVAAVATIIVVAWFKRKTV